MRFRRHWIFATFILTTVICVFGRSPCARAARSIRKDPFAQSANYHKWQDVSCLAQTPDGFIWLGTDVGLVRFDGLNFVEKPIGLNGNPDIQPAVGALLTMPDGGLLVGFSGETGIAKFKNGTFEVLVSGKKLDSPLLHNFAMGPDGVIWVAASSGVFSLDGNQVTQHSLPRTGKDIGAVVAVAVSPAGDVWEAHAVTFTSWPSLILRDQ